MAAILTLEDGRSLYGSSIGMASMYWAIADCIDDAFSDLRRWLRDVADRPTPFMDFDIRGLSPSVRDEFFRGAATAMRNLTAEHNPSILQESPAYHCLDRLLRMQEAVVGGEPPGALNDLERIKEFDGTSIDLLERWF
jgi:hypothetical protein